jgi:Sulfotransferase domain
MTPRPPARRLVPRFGLSELGAIIVSSILLGASFPRPAVPWSMPQKTTPVANEKEYPGVRVDYYDSEQPTEPATFSAEATVQSSPPVEGLKIAWLMSFPNSGTSYTSVLIRNVSLTHSGSNYGVENLGVNNTSVPIFADQESGPFYVDPTDHPEFGFAKRYILTKTHCGGRCERCEPTKYMETTYSFRTRCLSGKWAAAMLPNNTKLVKKGTYPPTRVAKAVHLLRNPFDNAVSRFHLERKIGHLPGIDHDVLIGTKYSNTTEGFRDFCKWLNKEYSELEHKSVWLSPELEKLTANIPCRADFFRYVEWHNQAEITIHHLQLKSYTLHYEWFATRFHETVAELLAFLELPNRGEAPEFLLGKNYSHEYFTADERYRMKQAMEFMASPSLWEHLKGYFDE